MAGKMYQISLEQILLSNLLDNFRFIHIGEHQCIIPDYTYAYTQYTHCIMTLEFFYFEFIHIYPTQGYQPSLNLKSKDNVCGSGGGVCGWKVCVGGIFIQFLIICVLLQV